MAINQTQPSTLSLTPGRGLRELSVPTDPAGFTGTSGIHFNQVLGGIELLAGLPLAGANNTGASYLSAIHGGLGSDVRTPGAAPAAGFNPNVPAFPNPEVTGYYVPPSPNAGNARTNGFYNTEKVLRSSSDAQGGANNGTVWQELQGRTHLNFSLWIARAVNPLPALLFYIELYRDLNAADKIAGRFGGGTGPTDLQNAQLVARWTAPQALREQTMPNFATSEPYALPAGCNLYLLFRSSDAAGNNLAAGSIWLS